MFVQKPYGWPMAQLSEIEVDLWCWSVADPAEATRLQACLSRDELARAGQFYRPDDRVAFVIRRGRMREILGARIGVPAGALRFTYNADGKPDLRGGPHFSLSHSAGCALLAVCGSGPLGVDVEAVKPLSADIGHVFTHDEQSDLNQVADADRLRATFRLWTQKEALSKALGIGVWLSAQTFSIRNEQGRAQVARMPSDVPANWSLMDLEAEVGMPSTLAIRSEGRAVRLRFH